MITFHLAIRAGRPDHLVGPADVGSGQFHESGAALHIRLFSAMIIQRSERNIVISAELSLRAFPFFVCQ